jgi:hypothetical protein
VGGLDFATAAAASAATQKTRTTLQHSIRAAKHRAEHNNPELIDAAAAAALIGGNNHNDHSPSNGSEAEFHFKQHSEHSQHSDALHADEVTMAIGALQMQTKVALDVFTSMRNVFCIPSDMLLTERNMVKIYASGYSRIPVYQAELGRHAILGTLVTRLLIVVNPREARPVSTLPLRTPRCVGPAMPLVDLLNMMQSGGKGSTGGHLALVCARPSLGDRGENVCRTVYIYAPRMLRLRHSCQNRVSCSNILKIIHEQFNSLSAFSRNEPLPETAGLLGVITLEDCLEMLLQEQIYDEMDKREQKANQLAAIVVKHWKRYVQRKKAGILQTFSEHHDPSILPVVERAMAAARGRALAETTALLEQGQAARNFGSTE